MTREQLLPLIGKEAIAIFLDHKPTTQYQRAKILDVGEKWIFFVSPHDRAQGIEHLKLEDVTLVKWQEVMQHEIRASRTGMDADDPRQLRES